MTEMYAPIGPLHEPANRSGVHGGFNRRCTCAATYGQSCEACDGTSAERFWRAADDAGQVIPPCMRPTTVYLREAS